MAENPKKDSGATKVSPSAVPLPVQYEVAVALTEGHAKYGYFNFRSTIISASTYYDACRRHLDSWWEGEDIDPDSGIHHVAKAISCLIVLRDCQFRGNVDDDRPPKSPDGWQDLLRPAVAAIHDKQSETRS